MEQSLVSLFSRSSPRVRTQQIAQRFAFATAAGPANWCSRSQKVSDDFARGLVRFASPKKRMPQSWPFTIFGSTLVSDMFMLRCRDITSWLSDQAHLRFCWAEHRVWSLDTLSGSLWHSNSTSFHFFPVLVVPAS